MKKFRENSQRAKMAEILIWVSGGLSLVGLITNFMEYRIYANANQGVFISMDEAQSFQITEVIVAILTVGVFIFSAITFIQWFRRAYFNQEMKFSMTTTNGWTAGAWFIPIYNLYRPYQLMKELYENVESFLIKNQLDETKKSNFAVLGWWWGLWITLNIAQNIVTRVSLRSESLDVLQSLAVASMAIELLYIPLAYITVKVIRNYNEMELVFLSNAGETGSGTKENSELLDTGI
ncbi:MAG: hypothetical protein K0R65_943 [Crocinitomicaceae bacterium]|jgi:heme/copper-type cytochrome/quinol oxidase subunit 2|nr:hypothetical protein [Crocinitomicaceae bacterium]